MTSEEDRDVLLVDLRIAVQPGVRARGIVLRERPEQAELKVREVIQVGIAVEIEIAMTILAGIEDQVSVRICRGRRFAFVGHGIGIAVRFVRQQPKLTLK